MSDINTPVRARRRDPLTQRQLEVLELLARGLPSRDIAAQLGITPGTTKTHLTMIYRKIGVKNRVQAARYYLDEVAPRSDK
jgi:DNA-binding CsgD family transcriptional regulator